MARNTKVVIVNSNNRKIDSYSMQSSISLSSPFIFDLYDWIVLIILIMLIFLLDIDVSLTFRILITSIMILIYLHIYEKKVSLYHYIIHYHY